MLITSVFMPFGRSPTTPTTLGTITITIVADCWDDPPSTLSKTNNSPLKIGHPNRKGLKVMIKTMGSLPTSKMETVVTYRGSLLTNYHYKDVPIRIFLVKMVPPQGFWSIGSLLGGLCHLLSPQLPWPWWIHITWGNLGGMTWPDMPCKPKEPPKQHLKTFNEIHPGRFLFKTKWELVHFLFWAACC